MKRDVDMIAAFNRDPLAGSIDLQPHYFGEFSMAKVQANDIMQDQFQVEVASRNALFLGVYDGHGGVDASTYVLNNLFHNLLRFAHNNDNAITEATLRDAVADTESEFLKHVEANINQIPLLGKVGTCCLAGVIWKDVLYVANLGDSRAVIGSVVNNKLHVEQLTRDHNCSNQAIRTEVQSLYPGDPAIVSEQYGALRVKGILKVSRGIGFTYLKRPAFSLLDSFPRYETIPEPFTRGVISAKPDMYTRAIADNDKFLLFATDGLWNLMTNYEAAEIVRKNPRHGIAKRLLSNALAEAARRRGLTYEFMRSAPPGPSDMHRRTFHDDISVIVVFLDKKPLFKKRLHNLSYRGTNVKIQKSEFEGSGLTDRKSNSFTAKGLKNSLGKLFMGSSSKSAEDERLVDQAESSQNPINRDEVAESEREQSSRPKSRWYKLKTKFKPKKH